MTKRYFTPFILLALTAAASGQVRDNAGFFTANAVERANQLISQTRQQTGKDLLVETIPSVPADQQDQLQTLGKERFFDQYTNTLAKQSGIAGVYVLVSRDPSYLKVAVGDNTQRTGAFTTADRDQLRDTLISAFKSKQYDQGLLDGVGQVQRTLVANSSRTKSAPASNGPTLQTFPAAPVPGSPQSSAPRTSAPDAYPAPAPRATGHGLLFYVVIGGVILFLIVKVLRNFAARATSSFTGNRGFSQPPPLPGQYPQNYGNSYPGSGSGFGRGLLGGLLGGAAGGWLYDRAAHRNDSPSFPGQSVPPSASPDSFPEPTPDRDFSPSSGGDFSAGGGDAGGGSDFSGGGDSGGGGSF